MISNPNSHLEVFLQDVKLGEVEVNRSLSGEENN